MSELHELLAVEGDLQGTFKKIMSETIATFTKKEGHFMGEIKTLQMFDESEKETAPERTELVTTVGEKLDYMFKSIVNYFDALLQKESTNQAALSSVVIDGHIITEPLPATFLLGMESRLKEIRTVIEGVPTLQPGVKWIKDETERKGVYVTEFPVEKFKTAKTFKHKVLYEATDKHPAQIEKWDENENVGKYVITKWSGNLTPLEKSEMLERTDKLIRAVKQARQKANKAEVTKIYVSDVFKNYILGE